ncbi:hypothetical protein JW911_04210 [Candidatus Peregrinibacteria bacterium]|nr:hypothetical protein [Candidatus Peregrinibacteria bacterium]
MIECIGVEQVGHCSHIIWTPSPCEYNWFERLAEEGHTGKKILLTIDEEDIDGATDVILMPGRDVCKKIYEALRPSNK